MPALFSLRSFSIPKIIRGKMRIKLPNCGCFAVLTTAYSEKTYKKDPQSKPPTDVLPIYLQ